MCARHCSDEFIQYPIPTCKDYFIVSISSPAFFPSCRPVCLPGRVPHPLDTPHPVLPPARVPHVRPQGDEGQGVVLVQEPAVDQQRHVQRGGVWGQQTLASQARAQEQVGRFKCIADCLCVQCCAVHLWCSGRSAVSSCCCCCCCSSCCCCSWDGCPALSLFPSCLQDAVFDMHQAAGPHLETLGSSAVRIKELHTCRIKIYAMHLLYSPSISSQLPCRGSLIIVD